MILGDHGELHWIAGILARMLSTDFGDGAADEILSGSGNDVILAGPDDDTVDAGDGDNIVFGDNGSIYWTGGVIDLATTRNVTGLGADDHIATGAGNDLIFGGCALQRLRFLQRQRRQHRHLSATKPRRPFIGGVLV